MPNIKLKGQTGEVLTYEDVERVYFDSADQDGEVVYYTHGVATSKTVEPDFASGDMSVPIADGELVTELTIKKPENLEEENIKYGIEVAGKTGKYVPSGTTKEIEPDFSEGDQTLTAEEGEFWNKVLIKKPETLIPENIRYGINIGGKEGTCVHVGTDPYIEYIYNEDGEVTAAKMYGFTEIPAGCFAFSSALTSVDLSGSPGITKIGDYAFRDCLNLIGFEIPDTVTSIGKYAFYGCDALTSIVIPDGVTSIPDFAFYSCNTLTSIVIPDSVTSIGEQAFAHCVALANVNLPDSLTSIDKQAFVVCTAIKSIDIPDGVISIGNQAFQGSGLTSITIPDSVTSFGTNVFNSCASLTSATLGSGITSIPNGTFTGCTSLQSITFRGVVTSIGNNAFGKCGLNSFIIPDSVTSVGSQAFLQCTALESVTIGSGVTSIGNNVFNGCTALTSATFKDTTTWYVGTSAGATTTNVSVTNASTAATYLRSTHVAKYWTKI